MSGNFGIVREYIECACGAVARGSSVMWQPVDYRYPLYSWYLALRLTLAVSVSPALAWATSVDIGAGARVDIPLRSFKALRDSHVVRQAYDYSCGAAALATLLTYGIEDTVTEQEILQFVLTSLAQDQQAPLKKQGLSLLDLQRVVQARG